jgi:hypothetical protein
MPKRRSDDDDSEMQMSDEIQTISDSKRSKSKPGEIDENDIINRLKNIFLNITNSPQYLNYIEFLIRQCAKAAVHHGPQYGPQYGDEEIESTFFPDEELASMLVEFRVLPPMPEIIKGVYYDDFKKDFFTGGFYSNAFKLLNAYIKQQQQVGGKKRSTKRKSTKRKSTKRKSAKRKSAKRKSAKRKSTKRKSAKRKSAKRKSAKRKSTKRKSVKRKSTKRKSTKRKSVKRKSTKRKSTKRSTRRNNTPLSERDNEMNRRNPKSQFYRGPNYRARV